MTDENKNEPLQQSEEIQQDMSTDVSGNKDISTPESDDVIELTDDREYPNQINMLREISHIYQHLTPSNKKIVRLSIARTA